MDDASVDQILSEAARGIRAVANSRGRTGPVVSAKYGLLFLKMARRVYAQEMPATASDEEVALVMISDIRQWIDSEPFDRVMRGLEMHPIEPM